MLSFTVETKKKKQVVDITDEVNRLLKKEGVETGLCHIFVHHTTAALTTADLDPGTDLDLLDAIDEMIPKLDYRHPHNPAHVKDHIASSLVGSSLSIPFQNNKLMLGTWQRIVLFEFDGPRSRNLTLHAVA